METTVTIPEQIITVPQYAVNRLLEKQYRARIAMRRLPIAMALNNRWKCHFRDKLRNAEEAVAFIRVVPSAPGGWTVAG